MLKCEDMITLVKRVLYLFGCYYHYYVLFLLSCFCHWLATSSWCTLPTLPCEEKRFKLWMDGWFLVIIILVQFSIINLKIRRHVWMFFFPYIWEIKYHFSVFCLFWFMFICKQCMNFIWVGLWIESVSDVCRTFWS